MNESPVRTKSFNFAKRIILFSIELREIKEFEIAKQLIRSGTSIGANVREAQRGFSKNDFKFKMSLSLKEADETMYWLELIEITTTKVPENLKVECDELIRILVSIVRNS